ncbi:hypothetical protein [Nocardia sp. NPDC050412]|uniref:hypothetical protein n=1 Tax=Nocardia sp. NPDC050412 TaxID=3364320 RepID=UPI0037BC11D8
MFDIENLEPGDRPAATPVASVPNGVVRGRNLVNEMDYHSVRNASRPGRDPVLGEIYRLQGFDGLPTIMEPNAIDNIVADGGIRLFRGVTESRYVDEFKFKKGAHFPGVGIGGNGTYASTDLGIARSEANGHPDQTIRMALLPTARITNSTKLAEDQERVLKAIDKKLERLQAAEESPKTRAKMQNLMERRDVLSDSGRFAAVRGYDAYRVDWGGAEYTTTETWVVFNRTAIVVER